MMKRTTMLLVLATLFALATASSAIAVTPAASLTDTMGAHLGVGHSPVTFGADGASRWEYTDARDPAGVRKLEGSYNPFEATATIDGVVRGIYVRNPHGGYATTTNHCKTCHAVHRATGAFALLRVDNPDHACNFCHIGTGRHSMLDAYFADPAGIFAANGHTIGSGPAIPDSSVWQWRETVTLTNVAGATQTIVVRRYLEARNQMMRYTVHGGRFIRVGPTALRCMSCHQVHNALNQIWQPKASGFLPDDLGNPIPRGTRLTQGYKLLRDAPSGGIAVEPTAILPDGTIRTAIGGVTLTRAFSRLNFTYHDPAVRGDLFRLRALETTVTIHTGLGAPPAPGTPEYLSGGSPNTTGYTRWTYFADGYRPFVTAAPLNRTPAEMPIYETSMAFWCADCHNLNIAGKQQVGTVWGTGRTGQNILGDRAHAVPAMVRAGTVAYAGSQCYKCHNSDMPLDGTGLFAGGTCGGCHITPEMYNYYKNRTAVARPGAPGTLATWAARNDAFMRGTPVAERSDWPHAGPSEGFKLLNARDRRHHLTAATNNMVTNPIIIDGRAGTDPVTGFLTDTLTFGTERGYDTQGSAFLPARGDGLDKACMVCHGGVALREIGVDK